MKAFMRLLYSITLASTLAACTIQSQTLVAPTTDPYIYHTQAAQTIEALEATRQYEAALATIVNQTLEAQFTQAPTATSTEQLPTTTSLPPSPTDTATLPPTPTFLPDDPRKSLGDPDFYDPFDSASNWYIYSDAASGTQVKNGKFHMTIFERGTLVRWTLTWPTIENFYMEVTALTPAACSGKDRYGLIFRAPDLSHGYLFSISCDGAYQFAKWDGEEYEVIVNWTSASFINSGPGKTNLLGVMAVGDKFSLYANGHFLTEVRDDDYTDAARFGVLVGSENTDDFTVQFDNFTYWLID